MPKKHKKIRILLLSRNHVVRDMVKLAAEKFGASLKTVKSPDELKDDRCDLLLVDEYFADRKWIQEASKVMLSKLSVLLAAYVDDKRNYFDRFVQKPFLPDDIGEIIEDLRLSRNESFTDEEREFDLGEFIREEESPPIEGPVLDSEEIEEIKRLLNDESSADGGGGHPHGESRGMEMANPEKIIDMLNDINPKKLRKLLRGAEIRISIRFPESEE